jgi:hypothetical protein
MYYRQHKIVGPQVCDDGSFGAAIAVWNSAGHTWIPMHVVFAHNRDECLQKACDWIDDKKAGK